MRYPPSVVTSFIALWSGFPKIISCLRTFSAKTNGLYIATPAIVRDKLSNGTRKEENNKKILAIEMDASVAVSSEINKYPTHIPNKINTELITPNANNIEMKFENNATWKTTCAITNNINPWKKTIIRFVRYALNKNTVSGTGVI